MLADATVDSSLPGVVENFGLLTDAVAAVSVVMRTEVMRPVVVVEVC